MGFILCVCVCVCVCACVRVYMCAMGVSDMFVGFLFCRAILEIISALRCVFHSSLSFSPSDLSVDSGRGETRRPVCCL